MMSGSLDRRVGILCWTKLQLHLAVCKWCRRYLAQIRLIRRVARGTEVVACSANSAGLSEEARRRITASLNADAESATAEPRP
jgi:hypothetical protein